MMRKAALSTLALGETMFGLLVHALTKFLIGDGKLRYNPARYYMRGPGPKWAEKHGMATMPANAQGKR